MLTQIRKKAISFYYSVVGSIALYPTIISLILFMLSIYLVNTDYIAVAEWLKDNATFLAIANAEAARTVLATIIGGVISLTVFSFSMVMLTLNQASTNFSHRILPGLVSERNNQIVLGFYLGTAVYSLVVLLSIRSGDERSTELMLSVLISMILFISCLALFIYFINHISTNIQIDKIMNDLFVETSSDLNKLSEEDKKVEQEIDIKKVSIVNSLESKFYHGVVRDEILKICEKENINLHIIPYMGQFVLEGQPLFYFDQAEDEDLVNEIRDRIILSNSNINEDSYRSGFNLLTEIGVKAMSPGINDPATAVATIDYLSSLYLQRLKISDYSLIYTSDKRNVLRTSRQSFDELLRNSLSQYRLYCKENVSLMHKLKNLLEALSGGLIFDNSYETSIENQLKAIKHDIKKFITNPIDLEEIG